MPRLSSGGFITAIAASFKVEKYILVVFIFHFVFADITLMSGF